MTRAKQEKPIESTAEEVVPDEQPSGAALVALDDTASEVLVVVDRHDEAQILSELQRRALKVMLYSFPLDGANVTDLSYLGVNEAIRQMNNAGKWRIRIDPDHLVIDEVIDDLGNGDEPCWRATVYGVNELTGYGQFGTATQPKRLKLKDTTAAYRRSNKQHVADDNTIGDKFARQKALSKAQRNALRIHIPEEIRQTIIAQYAGDPTRIERIPVGQGASSLADLPAPLTDARANEQRDTARALYSELMALTGPAANPPGAFHAYLTRSEHDHERLDEFIEYLRGLIEKAKAEIAAKQADEPPPDVVPSTDPDPIGDEAFGSPREETT